MSTEEYINKIRNESIESLCEEYANMFESCDLEDFSDSGMKGLASYWKNSSEVEKKLLKEFIRLGAQNSTASVLASIDSEFDESILSSGDLLDEFWNQEEDAGNVYKST
ncbi:hypothetical protein LJ739_00285 [Aestuariibacter halophilus]|uniref:DUF4375 domain-containing protein n=1 Tax=Fluctibacter halophilus TaxID=226011 RepID=A0ABS8G269_9ALTE|nr:hypothetical protein [Aestuariibacter halophilus]MCC2614675.1 hypothetical protein [Aestuariibacter halophilus]